MQVFMDQLPTFVTARIRMPWIQQPSVCLWMLCAASKSMECYGLARHVALSLSYAGINQTEMKPIVSLDTRSTISVSRTFLILFVSIIGVLLFL